MWDKALQLILSNKDWLFSGLGLTIFALVWKFWGKCIGFFLRTSKHPVFALSGTAAGAQTERDVSSESASVATTLSEAKQNTKILFVDDDTAFKVVNILKSAGWTNTAIHKDVGSLDDPEVTQTDIFFIDINGVGKRLMFSDEGLGLARAIKKKYPKKTVIIYSAHPKADWNHQAWSIIDDRLSKNADPYEFQQMVEDYTVNKKQL